MPAPSNLAVLSYDLSASIASGQTTSAPIDLLGTQLCGLIMPSSFTGSAVSIQMSNSPTGTFVTMQDGNGNDYSLAVTASRYIPINNLAIVAGARYIQLVSNSSEAAARTIILAVRPV